LSQISIKDLTFAYEGSYDNIFENVSLTLDTDWRLRPHRKERTRQDYLPEAAARPSRIHGEHIV